MTRLTSGRGNRKPLGLAKPVLMIVDDDPEVLSAVERDLRAHYKGEYRLVKAGGPEQAIQAAEQLAARGASVALFLVDERMPGMTGTQLLMKLKELHPDARKVLLTAYADTEAAIASINKIGLDHYLLKPWDPPSERLYPILDDLLLAFRAKHRPAYEGIRVAGARLSPTSFLIKDFLSRNHIPYQWIDVETSPPTRALVAQIIGEELARLPVVFFPDGSHLVCPETRELADKVGLKTRASEAFYDLVIIGGGPAGLAAAVYGGTEGLRVCLVEQAAPGGQAGSSSNIENYLGFPAGISGAELARRAVAQATRFGAELLGAQEVKAIRREDPYRTVCLADGSELSAYAVLLCTGVALRTLDLPSLEPFLGRGVFYGAAMTEAATYRGEDVVVVGGANSAGQGALFFAQYCKKVTMVIRAERLGKGMSTYLSERIRTIPNIEAIASAEVAEVSGDGKLEAITLRVGDSGEMRTVRASAMFVFIGAHPRTELVRGLVECDAQGFIKTGPDLGDREARARLGFTLDRDPYLHETSVPGIFAAGDVRLGSGKRVANAVGEGSATISMVHRYIQTV
jgi:thioredoxin reductase (NADPH)